MAMSIEKGGACAFKRTQEPQRQLRVSLETGCWLASGADARHAQAAAMLTEGGNHEALDTDSTHGCCNTGVRAMGRRTRDVAGPHRDPTANDAVWQLY